MIGSIIGDIIGSRWEGTKHPKTENFLLFHKKCRFTDDTVLTCAIADVLMNGDSFTDAIRDYYRMYPERGYGSSFRRWATSDSQEGYGSYGNGSAMRVSPIAFFYDSSQEVLSEAEISAVATHNHEEGVRGAKVIALATFLARKGKTKQEIASAVEDLGCRTDVLLNSRALGFDCSCQETVPQAINAFLYSSDFEDCIRRAIMMGGDSDTIASMAGSIAHAYYRDIPPAFIEQSFRVMPQELIDLTCAFMRTYIDKRSIVWRP